MNTKQVNKEWKNLRQLIADKVNSVLEVANTKDGEKQIKLQRIKAELDLLIDDFISKSQHITLADVIMDDDDDETPKLNVDQVATVTEILKIVNPSVEKFLSFMKEFTTAKSVSEEELKKIHWIKFLFSNGDKYKVQTFDSNKFWIALRNYTQLKEIVGLVSIPIHNEYAEDIKEGLEFQGHITPNQWKITFNFFLSLKQRFGADIESINIATRLFLIHEAVHFEHGLTSYSVRGIGNFAKTIEEADYQADTYAIVTEFAYQILVLEKENKTIDHQELILKLIETAINTTFSFVPKSAIPIKRAQIRRVNRTLIWAYQYRLIKFITEADTTKKLEKIFEILATKPVVELHGPKVLVSNNKNRPRIFFDFQNFEEPLHIATFFGNEVHRHPYDPVSSKEMIDGLRETDFHKICEAMGTFFTAVKISKNI